jgi:hypothetical protein
MFIKVLKHISLKRLTTREEEDPKLGHLLEICSQNGLIESIWEQELINGGLKYDRLKELEGVNVKIVRDNGIVREVQRLS